MRNLATLFLACYATVVTAVSSWGFEDASLSIHKKKAATGGGLKEKYVRFLEMIVCLVDETQTF